MDTPSTVEQRGPRTRSRARANVPALSSGFSRNVMNPDPPTIGNSEASARSLEKLHEKVFRNPLLVMQICSFAESSDLCRLRLVNHLFLREATKALRKVHPPIQLADELELEQFLKFEKTRKEIPYKRFPYASFNLNMSGLGPLPTELFEKFAKQIGQHVLRLSFRTCLSVKNIGDKVGTLLAHTPNLTEFKLSSVKRIYISNDLLRQIPLTFPGLTNVNVNYTDFTSQGTYENETPLLEILISRAPRLQNFNIPVSSTSVVQAPDLGILKYLLKNRDPNARPIASFFDGIRIYPKHLDFIWEMMRVKFLTIEIMLCNIQNDLDDNDNAQEIMENMMDRVHSWLSKQTHLRSLTVSTRVNLAPLRLPSLSSLKELNLSFFNDSWRFLVLVFPPNPIVQFNPNQFPALQKLRLSFYRDQYDTFTFHPPLTSVLHLDLSMHMSPFDNPRWQYLFPNLTSLQIELEPRVDWSSTLTFILRYFSRLVNLDLEMSRAQPQPLDLWNILTGGAPRPVNNYTLMNGRVRGEIGNLAEPVDGIYDLPSLRNMKALKSLMFSEVSGSTLDAILYMTRAELLVPLDVLKLYGIKFNTRMKAGDILPYQWRLARVHSKVYLW